MTPGKPSYSIDGNDSQVHSSIYIIKGRIVSKLSLWQTNTFSWSRSREIDLISPDCQTVGFYFLKEVGSGGGGGLSADQLFANDFFLVIHPLFSDLFGIEHRSVIVVGIITKQYQVSTPSSGKIFKPCRCYNVLWWYISNQELSSNSVALPSSYDICSVAVLSEFLEWMLRIWKTHIFAPNAMVGVGFNEYWLLLCEGLDNFF